MKIKTILVGIISLYILSCSAPEQIATFHARNLKSIDSIDNQDLAYCLPQTSLRVDFEVTFTEEIPGPYVDFAELLLGLDNIIEAHNDFYSIDNISIIDYPQPDYNQYYVVEFNETKQDNFFQLSNNGFLMSINDAIKESDNNAFATLNLVQPELDFDFGPTDRFTKRNVVTKSEKKYKTVKTDSTTIRVPVSRSYDQAKSVKDNAEEAANFIIKIRKRKLKLMAGLYTNAPDGEAVPQMIEELKLLEQNYVELFTGTIRKTTFYYSFDYTPDPNNAIKSYTLCYFSESKGIHTIEDLSNSPNLEKGLNLKPININIDADLSVLKNLDKVKKETKEVGLPYRIPVYCAVEIDKGNEIILQNKMLISQFGKIAYLPEFYISDKYKVLFYEDKGSLKLIEKK